MHHHRFVGDSMRIIHRLITNARSLIKACLCGSLATATKNAFSFSCVVVVRIKKKPIISFYDFTRPKTFFLSVVKVDDFESERRGRKAF